MLKKSSSENSDNKSRFHYLYTYVEFTNEDLVWKLLTANIAALIYFYHFFPHILTSSPLITFFEIGLALNLCICGWPWMAAPTFPIQCAGIIGVYYPAWFYVVLVRNLGLHRFQASVLPTELHPQPSINNSDEQHHKSGISSAILTKPSWNCGKTNWSSA